MTQETTTKTRPPHQWRTLGATWKQGEAREAVMRGHARILPRFGGEAEGFPVELFATLEPFGEMQLALTTEQLAQLLREAMMMFAYEPEKREVIERIYGEWRTNVAEMEANKERQRVEREARKQEEAALVAQGILGTVQPPKPFKSTWTIRREPDGRVTVNPPEGRTHNRVGPVTVGEFEEALRKRFGDKPCNITWYHGAEARPKQAPDAGVTGTGAGEGGA